MCGIIGIISKNINSIKAYQVLQKINHRGPDEEGIYYCNNVYLGHKRLVVVDKFHGKQPFIYKNLIMIYNGELYNTDELRNTLKTKGYSFLGHSDTEVLIKMYFEYGKDCCNKLNGIFSFVIWDNQKKELFACRDRVGVKPLYYYHNNDEFMVSSEIKTILNYYDINKITLEGLQEILGLGPSHSPGNGIYKDVHELRGAHFLKLKNNKIIIKRYWQLKSKEHLDNFEITVDKTRYLLEDSIKRQLVSDVPLCTFLSGGLDSTAITLIAKKYKPNIESFSIDYRDNKKYFNANDYQVSLDNDFISLIINKYKIKHKKFIIDNEQLAKTLKDALILRDMPGMVDIDSSLYWFSKQIKNEFTVALSGECADEIFGGYPWYYRKSDSNTFPWLVDLDERNKLLNNKYQRLLNLNEYVKEKHKLILNEVPLDKTESIEEKNHKELFYLNLIYFMTTLLDRKDRMTMGASLEVRVPFADHRLIEYLYNVPKDMLYYQKMEKWLLKEAVKDIVPIEIIKRKKNPYPKTYNPEYTNLVKKLLEGCLNKKDSILYEIFDKKALNNILNDNSKLFNRPWFGQLMTRPQLIAYLYQIDLWFKEYNLNIVE